jgi:hypothetical protein
VPVVEVLDVELLSNEVLDVDVLELLSNDVLESSQSRNVSHSSSVNVSHWPNVKVHHSRAILFFMSFLGSQCCG